MVYIWTNKTCKKICVHSITSGTIHPSGPYIHMYVSNITRKMELRASGSNVSGLAVAPPHSAAAFSRARTFAGCGLCVVTVLCQCSEYSQKLKVREHVHLRRVFQCTPTRRFLTIHSTIQYDIQNRQNLPSKRNRLRSPRSFFRVTYRIGDKECLERSSSSDFYCSRSRNKRIRACIPGL